MMKLLTFLSLSFFLMSCQSFVKDKNLYPISIKNKMGFIDSTGVVVIPCRFDYVGEFNDGLAIAITDSMYGYIDKKGEYLIKPIYNLIDHIKYGTSEISFRPYDPQKKQLFLAYLKVKSDTLYNYDLPSIYNFSEGRAVYYEKGKYGYIDTEGNKVIKAQFAFAKNFSEGLAAVKVKMDDKILGEELYGYINPKGDFLIKPQYSIASNFTENKASVGITYNYKDEDTNHSLYNIKVFAINTKGQILFSPEVQGLTKFQNGYAGCYNLAYAGLTGSGWNFIDSTGNYYVPYDKLSFLSIGSVSNPKSLVNSITYTGGNKFLTQIKNGKWGFLPKDLTTLNKSVYETLIYDDAYPFTEDIALVKMNGKWGYIDAFETFVIKPVYTSAKQFHNGLAYVEQFKTGFKLKGYINAKGLMVWSSVEH